MIVTCDAQGHRSGSISVRVPTESLNKYPELLDRTRRDMEADIRDAGCVPDPTSWRRKDEDAVVGTLHAMPALTTFTLSSALNVAHVIWHISGGGYYSASSSTVAVVLTGEADAQRLVDALNKSHGYEPDEDGEWDDAHYYFRVIPVSA